MSPPFLEPTHNEGTQVTRRPGEDLKAGFHDPPPSFQEEVYNKVYNKPGWANPAGGTDELPEMVVTWLRG